MLYAHHAQNYELSHINAAETMLARSGSSHFTGYERELRSCRYQPRIIETMPDGRRLALALKTERIA